VSGIIGDLLVPCKDVFLEQEIAHLLAFLVDFLYPKLL
jgi:hypothetical protein